MTRYISLGLTIGLVLMAMLAASQDRYDLATLNLVAAFLPDSTRDLRTDVPRCLPHSRA